MDKLSKLSTLTTPKCWLLFCCCSFAHKAWVTGLCLYEQVSLGKEFNFLFSLLQELVHLQGLGVELGKCFFACLNFHQVNLEMLTAFIFHVVKDPALCFHSKSICMRQLLCWLFLLSSHCLPSAAWEQAWRCQHLIQKLTKYLYFLIVFYNAPLCCLSLNIAI